MVTILMIFLRIIWSIFVHFKHKQART